MLLVLSVPLPAVMQVMGWSETSMAKRYMHVPNECLAAIAAEVSSLIWADPKKEDNGPRELSCTAVLSTLPMLML